MTENSTSRGGTFADDRSGHTSRNQWDVRHALERQEAAKTPTERLIDANIARHRAQQAEAQQREAAKAAQQQRDRAERNAREAAERARLLKRNEFKAKEALIEGVMDGLTAAEKSVVFERLARAKLIHDWSAASAYAAEVVLARRK
jgi:hypothetical protein